jgi:hypothetical protein
MTHRLKRWLSILLLAALGFSHASLAVAACVMDRADLSQMLASQDAVHECCDTPDGHGEGGNVSMTANACMAQGTADLQLYGSASVPVLAGASPRLVLVVLPAIERPLERRLIERPPAAVPSRILLHSFLI